MAGRMEFGPRALCGRSILADARSTKMQSYLNLATKFRESFRPFAPACLEEKLSDYFVFKANSPYMLMVAPIREDLRIELKGDERDLDVHEWVNRERSTLPAITHVDFSARKTTSSFATNEVLHSKKPTWSS